MGRIEGQSKKHTPVLKPEPKEYTVPKSMTSERNIITVKTEPKILKGQGKETHFDKSQINILYP